MTTSKDNYEMKDNNLVTESGGKFIQFMKKENRQMIAAYEKNEIELKQIDE